ncbi:hypothetical protein VPHD235_0113 [Vibrio phage D235]
MKKFVVAVYDINEDQLTQQLVLGTSEYDAVMQALEESDAVGGERAKYLANEAQGCLGTLREITHDYMSINLLELK